MFVTLSEALDGVFSGLGIDAGRAGNTGRDGKGAGRAAEGEQTHPATARQGGGNAPMGIRLEKDAARKQRQFNREVSQRQPQRRETGGFAFQVHTNPDVPTSTKKRAKTTLLLVVA